MKKLIAPLVLLLIHSFICAQEDSIKIQSILHYQLLHPENGKTSRSIGTVSNGKLENGKLMPYSGKNFFYFDSTSYVNGRAFVNGSVKNCVLETYGSMDTLTPGQVFGVMECSNEKGGKIYPHNTHQNGLSIDFMTPLLKDGITYTDLDTLGADHYWLEFSDDGTWKEDSSVSIDFNLVARHILVLNSISRKYGLKISKVIFKLELKDELFNTEYGQQLQATGIYFAQNLPHLINSLHDDHYHIDFEFI